MTEETAADLKLFITRCLQQQDTRWHNEITKLGMDLRVEMQQGYQKLDAKIDRFYNELDQKIDYIYGKLDTKIDSVHDKLDAKIDHLANTVFDALDTYHNNHEQRIQKLETSPTS